MLRDYQVSAVSQTISAFRLHDAVALRAPTGAGKTLMAQAITEVLELKPLAIAHTTELVKQWRERGTDAITVQSYLKDSSIQDDYGLLIVDEAHHYCRNLWERVITSATRRVLALSATFSRQVVYHGYEHLYGACVSTGTYQELRDDGYLVPLEVRLPGIEGPWDGETLGFEYMASLEENSQARNLQGLVDWVSSELRSRKSIIYVSSKGDARRLTEMLQIRGIDAGLAIGGDTEAMADFEDKGAGTALVTVQLVSEGIDFPSCDAVVLARFIGSFVTYRQVTGRASRPHDSKAVATIYDYCGTTLHHGHPMNEDVVTIKAEDLGKAPVCAVCWTPVYEGDKCPKCGNYIVLHGGGHIVVKCPACRGKLSPEGRCHRCALVAKFEQGVAKSTQFQYGGVKFLELSDTVFGNAFQGVEYSIDFQTHTATVGEIENTNRSLKALLAWVVTSLG